MRKKVKYYLFLLLLSMCLFGCARQNYTGCQQQYSYYNKVQKKKLAKKQYRCKRMCKPRINKKTGLRKI